MTRDQATREAREIAKRDGITMVVTFDPFAENPDETQNYGYFPNAATGIFSLEKVVETIDPNRSSIRMALFDTREIW